MPVEDKNRLDNSIVLGQPTQKKRNKRTYSEGRAVNGNPLTLSMASRALCVCLKLFFPKYQAFCSLFLVFGVYTKHKILLRQDRMGRGLRALGARWVFLVASARAVAEALLATRLNFHSETQYSWTFLLP